MARPLADDTELGQITRTQFDLLNLIQTMPRERRVQALVVLLAILGRSGVDIRRSLEWAERLVEDAARGELPHLKAAIEYAEKDLWTT